MPAVSFVVPHIDTKPAQRSINPCDIRSPLSALRTSAAYYHPAYPANSPDVDLVLASSDHVPCWFAVNKSKLFCHTDTFRSVGLEQLTPDNNLPLVQLGESRDVIEVMLACLEADSLPDFGKLDFRVIVSALEAAADKYRLIHTEKICLLALGAYCATNPVEVYTLASHYYCRWLAEAASEHTLNLDITQPDYQDILTSENYIPLLDLHQSRIQSAKLIIQNQAIESHGDKCDISKLQAFWADASLRIISRITSPALDIDQLFEPEMKLAVQELSPCLNCYSILVQIRDQVRNECLGLRRTVNVPVVTPGRQLADYFSS
ncbi:uncharacterized protein MELLADRAFT_73412 [Melampsora larici-populina 98AG31]|uniref:BTB domain-containing protein n=1 Tax=Melampsora larici-populina (strain 98AG31 / pathotype 3-4-7) TaxID=747676 RepID=F4S7I8_MELLP|nr:uncharacterized protein MELLADRAFT_73412 [Melampsora larici-populina 98AG31]EGF99415.1 hypothetical protein MELLADRAFT_73412 [Melampsora larici-populina 98AG31]